MFQKETGTSAHDVIVGYFWSFDVQCFVDLLIVLFYVKVCNSVCRM